MSGHRSASCKARSDGGSPVYGKGGGWFPPPFSLGSGTMRQSDPFTDPQHGVRLVEGIEMQACHAVIEQIRTLRRRMMDADLADRFWVRTRSLERLEQLGRETRAARQHRHPFHHAKAGDRQDTSDDRHADSSQFAASSEVVEIMVVQKQLSADVVRPRIHFGLEVVHF